MTEGNDARPAPLDELLKAAFAEGPRRGESVLRTIERLSGTKSRILLRDVPDDDTPVLRLHAADSEDAAKDDSRYQILGEIARGGVGIVFKGRDRDLGRSVAVKVLRKEHAAREQVVHRFIEEAQIGGQLQHPGIVPVYGLGLQEDGRPYFATAKAAAAALSGVLDEIETSSSLAYS